MKVSVHDVYDETISVTVDDNRCLVTVTEGESPRSVYLDQDSTAHLVDILQMAIESGKVR